MRTRKSMTANTMQLIFSMKHNSFSVDTGLEVTSGLEVGGEHTEIF